jgi:adenosylcobinamide kinase/adenosylcobinamide-phosphate guanylyltransferase
MEGVSGRVLVIGGARSGKSAYAESLLTAQPDVTYVATGPTRHDDPEWAARVAAHKLRRPPGWRTLETTELGALLGRTATQSLIVDSVTTWLSSAMDAAGSWTEDTGAPDRLRAAVDGLVAAWAGAPGRVVAVTDEVGQGVVPETSSGRLFRDELGALNQRLAAAADGVWLVTAGIPLRLK